MNTWYWFLRGPADPHNANFNLDVRVCRQGVYWTILILFQVQKTQETVKRDLGSSRGIHYRLVFDGCCQLTSFKDACLVKAVEENGAKNWKKIADSVKGRTDVQCLHRWQKVLNPDLVKGPWTEEVCSRSTFQLLSLNSSKGRRKGQGTRRQVWPKKMVIDCVTSSGSNWETVSREVTFNRLHFDRKNHEKIKKK